MKVRLHIERLVLDGVAVSHAGQAQLQAALETELARLIADGGVSPSFALGLAVPSVAASGITLAATAGPHEIGQQVAGALYGGLKR